MYNVPPFSKAIKDEKGEFFMIFRKWLGEVELTKDLSLLLFIGGIYSLSVALSNTFVNIYLWKQSGEFIDLAVYNLSVVIFQPLTFILAGRWAKKIDRVIVLRIGVIFLALFYISVLLFGEHASRYLIVLGGLLGIGYGFYWLAFNVLTFEITEPETRDFFNGFLGTFELWRRHDRSNISRIYHFEICFKSWLHHCVWSFSYSFCTSCSFELLY